MQLNSGLLSLHIENTAKTNEFEFTEKAMIIKPKPILFDFSGLTYGTWHLSSF